MIMLAPMDDITGKKFSLQDWVMKRAANQSGSIMPPLSMRQSVSNGTAHGMSYKSYGEDEPEMDVKPFSNVSRPTPSLLGRALENLDKQDRSEKQDEPKEKVVSTVALATVATASQNGAAPFQQLQIVKLLTDLGDRLRQSEKEREILWKELDTCRKQIEDIGNREGKKGEEYSSLEGQIKEREQLIKDLQEKQSALEQKLADQALVIESSKQDHAKLQEKMSSVETSTGSAIVRVEDAIAENQKLSKRVEQLGQDKARLLQKLDHMEETLAQTQDTLKAKALVLLTDQALASRTNLPQTPAWTGNDTLKMSTPAAAPDVAAKPEPVTNPLNDLVSTMAAARARVKRPISYNSGLLVGLVLLGIVGGVILSRLNFDTMFAPAPDKQNSIESQSSFPADKQDKADDKVSALSQNQIVSQIATLANQIEPSSYGKGEPVTITDGFIPPVFDSAQAAQDKAVKNFEDSLPKGDASDRLSADPRLPARFRDLEARALDGDANAQHDLAAIYTAGQTGVKINYTKAAQWFEEASYQGVSNAQYNLAVLYHQGLGVSKDTKKAIELYRVAAANGHAEADYNLAIAYVEGVGTEYNPQVAAVYFQKAAAGGIVEAAYNLGLLHENGLLGESQPDEAVFWYTLAADKGNAEAQKALKQIKVQLSMSNEDAARIVARIASEKPGFTNEDGQAALPEALVERPAAEHQDNIAITGVPDSAILFQVQQQLSQMGLYLGPVSGVPSPKITQAIKDYQKNNGLRVDGKATDDLLVHMLASSVQHISPAEGQE